MRTRGWHDEGAGDFRHTVDAMKFLIIVENLFVKRWRICRHFQAKMDSLCSFFEKFSRQMDGDAASLETQTAEM